MKLTFIGADHKTTGSCHLLEVGVSKILTDRGMEQGSDVYQNAELPASYREIDYAFLTHAHIDHVGMLPWIYTGGFRGQAIAIYATVDLCNIILKDSAHIQEVEAEWKSRKVCRASHVEVEVLYTMEDVESILKHFEGVAYGQESKLNNDLTLRFTDVGHLLGSVFTEIWAVEDEETKKIVFSDDIGNRDKPLIRDPQYTSEADYVVMESTYGNRYHKKDVNHVGNLARIIQETLDRSGNVVIPAFTVRRTQELLCLTRHIKDEKLAQGHDGFEVYVDSPLVVEATHVSKKSMMGRCDAETRALVERGINPTDFLGLELSITSEESKNINLDMMPRVIILAAGMCGAGRVRHHLKHNLRRQECSIVFVGYQTESTLGRMFQDDAQTVKIFGKEIDIRAHIETMDDTSGHMDRDGLITWISSFEKRPGHVFVIHGDEESCASSADALNTQLKLAARAPYSGPQHNLIKGCWTKEAELVLIEKETATKRKVTGVYARFMNAGRPLTDVISHNQGGTNKDPARSAEQILALCNKWGR